MADAVTILSNSWTDNNSGAALSSRNATATTVNTAILAGDVPSNANGDGIASGGAHNFPRFLENWDSVNFTYYGSLVEAFHSNKFTGSWQTNNVYHWPNRLWNFDTVFLQKQPPGVPTGHPVLPRPLRTQHQLEKPRDQPRPHEAVLFSLCSPWACLAATAVSARAGIDFTLRTRQEDAGAPDPEHRFITDGDNHIYLRIPKDWTASGGGNQLVLTPGQPSGEVVISQLQGVQALPLDPAGLTALRQSAQAAVPQGAKNIKPTGEIIDLAASFRLEELRSHARLRVLRPANAAQRALHQHGSWPGREGERHLPGLGLRSGA